MKKFLKIAGLVLAISFGAFMIVYGEFDDSPGAQFLGLIVAALGIFLFFKKKK